MPCWRRRAWAPVAGGGRWLALAAAVVSGVLLAVVPTYPTPRWQRVTELRFAPPLCSAGAVPPRAHPPQYPVACFTEAARRVWEMRRRRSKVYPISFCYPRDVALYYHRRFWHQNKTRLVAEGLYGKSVRRKDYFTADEGAYLAQYAGAHYVRTKKKAGWDCWRHLEIIVAGAVPVMQNASAIDPLTMFHYPKECFASFAALAEQGVPPSAELRASLWAYFLDHLTCDQMIHFAMAAAGYTPCRGKVLFLDGVVARQSDYMSTSVLIGLRSVLGPLVEVWREPRYLYSNWQGDPHKLLYGNGLGYAMAIDGALLSPGLRDGDVRRRLRLGHYDAVVYGSYSRSLAFWEVVRAALPAERVWAFHGEDDDPLRAAGREFHTSGRAAHALSFVREMLTDSFACPPRWAAPPPLPKDADRRCLRQSSLGTPEATYPLPCFHEAELRIRNASFPFQVVPISLAFPRRWVEAHAAGPWPAEGQRRGRCLPPGPGEANPMAALARCDVLALDAEGDAERFLLQAYAAGVLVHWPADAAPDAARLFHHPKECFPTLRATAPAPALHSALRHGAALFLRRHLTCEAVVEFMLRAVGYDACAERPVLFLDAVVAEEPQPLALTVLLGLKALLPGPGRLDVWREPPYLYRGWQGHRANLLHSGMGYAEELDPAQASAPQPERVLRQRLREGHYGAVVYGSFALSRPFFGAVRRALPPARVWAVGGPGPELYDEALAPYVTQFVRESRSSACHR